MEPLVATTRDPAPERPTEPRPAIDHTLGALAAVVDLPPAGGVPAARLGVLHWPPPPGVADPRRGNGAAMPDPRRRWQRARAHAPSREIVLLHGLSGNAATQAPVAAVLAAEGWSVRAFDLPGHGRSRWLADDGSSVRDPESMDPSVYGLDRIAGTIARAIGALGLDEPPILVGHSWGAGIAVAAVLESAPVSRLVLVDPPFLSAEGARDLASELVGELRHDLEEARDIARVTEPDADEVDLAARAEALTQASALAVAAAATHTGYGPFELLGRWRAARPAVRVDVIAGSPAHGGLVPGRARLALRFFLGRGRVHYLPEAGHSPQRSHFAEYMALLRRLLLAG